MRAAFKKDSTDDPDEFINEPKTSKKQENKATPSTAKQQPIKIVNIPAHLRTNWDNFYVEIIMIIGIVIYVLNFFTGKSKNQKMANQLFNAHRSTLESQFSLVGGDAGGAEAAQEAGPGRGHLQPDEAGPRPDPRQGGHEPRGHGQLHLLHCFQEELFKTVKGDE